MGTELTMVHKPCMALWLFTNNHSPLLLDFACHPENLVFTQQKGTCIFQRRALEAITALRWLRRQPWLLVFFPQGEVQPGVFSIGLSCCWAVQGPWRRHSPAGCDGVPCLWNGRTMALRGFVFCTRAPQRKGGSSS